MSSHGAGMDRKKIGALLAELIAVGNEDRCLTCDCYLDVLRQVQEDILSRDLVDLPETEILDEMIGRVYAERSHGCLGCDPCLPVEPFNAFNEVMANRAESTCCAPASGEKETVSEGTISWPPFPGEYVVLDKDGCGAVCTLADETLYEALRCAPLGGVALVGMMNTENLGIERLVRNVVASPRLRWLLLCGKDSRGHRAGECLVALAENGVDSEMRIVGATGKRARLVDLSLEEVEAFRRGIRVFPKIGLDDIGEICRLAKDFQNTPFTEPTRVIRGAPAGEKIPAQAESPADPAGYFVIDVLADRSLMRLEHYTPEHRVTAALLGGSARDLYLMVVRQGLVSSLEHAAYLGYELGKAERAMLAGGRYVQDRPEDCQ
jgi:tetrahydromethanopterin S-methyltransferase subunit A